jgi:hypothetical protein
MAQHELPRAAAERVRAEIDNADLKLTSCIRWLPIELQDELITKEEVESKLRQGLKEWGQIVYGTILQEWASIGVAPNEFDAIAEDQIQNLSIHAEERIVAVGNGIHLTSCSVAQLFRQLFARLNPQYREANRFRFESLSSRPISSGPLSAESILAQPPPVSATGLSLVDQAEIEQQIAQWRSGISVDITLLNSWAGRLADTPPLEAIDYFRELPAKLLDRSFLEADVDWEGSGAEVLGYDQITETILRNFRKALKRFAEKAIRLVASKWVDKGIRLQTFTSVMESAGDAIKQDIFEMARHGISRLAEGASVESLEQAMSKEVGNGIAREIGLYRRKSQLIGLADLPRQDDSSGSDADSTTSRRPAQEESGILDAGTTASPSSSDAIGMDSPARIRFEAGLARAEVTLNQALEDPRTSLEATKKYVVDVTITFANCMLTPNCAEPHETIRKAYEFAENLAEETGKRAGFLSCVLDAEAPPEEMRFFGTNKWVGFLNWSAREALDEFVPQFWKRRFEYFSELAGRSAHFQPSAVTTGGGNPGESGDRAYAPSSTPDITPPRRVPDLDTSRERLALVEVLARELAIVKQEVRRYRTVEQLKRKHPAFMLWDHIEDSQVKELVDGAAFTPKAYAENLTLTKFGLTSRETLKKDRQKIRKAKKTGEQ